MESFRDGDVLGRLRRDAQLGDWATFVVRGPEGREAFIRFAVVGDGSVDAGRPAYWLEMELGHERRLRSPTAAFRMLVERSSGFRRTGIRRMAVAVAHSPAAWLSETQLRAWANAPGQRRGASSFESSWRAGAPGRLLSHAGSVEATPYQLQMPRGGTHRVWVSPNVPVLGIAKMELEGHAWEVSDFGHDATPRVRVPPETSSMLDPGATAQ